MESPAETTAKSRKAPPVKARATIRPAKKRSPEEASHLVAIRKANLLSVMATWVYNQNMAQAAGETSGQAGHSDSDFAALLGISKSYLSQIKSGGKQVQDKLARQFESRLQLTPGTLDVPPPTTGIEAFIEVAQASWHRLNPVQRDQLQALLSQPGLGALLSFLQATKNS